MNMEAKAMITDEVRTIARRMITCSHENMLDDKEFDKYLSEIITKALKHRSKPELDNKVADALGCGLCVARKDCLSGKPFKSCPMSVKLPKVLALIPDETEGYFRGRQDGLSMLEANVEQARQEEREQILREVKRTSQMIDENGNATNDEGKAVETIYYIGKGRVDALEGGK